MGDGNIDIKLTATDDLTPALRDAEKATNELVDTTERKGLGIGSWTELKSQIDIVIGAAKTAYQVFDQIEKLQISGAIDKNLNAAFERMVGNISNVERLREAVNFTQEDTELVRFANTLSRFGAGLDQISIIAAETKRVSDDLGVSIQQVQSQVESAVRSGNIRALRAAFGDVADIVALQIELYETQHGKMTDVEQKSMTLSLLSDELAKSGQQNANVIESQTDHYLKESAALDNLISNVGIVLDNYEKLDEGNTLLTETYQDLADVLAIMDEQFMKQWETMDTTGVIMTSLGNDAMYMSSGLAMTRAEFVSAAIQGEAFTENIKTTTKYVSKLTAELLLGLEGLALYSQAMVGVEAGPKSKEEIDSNRAERLKKLLAELDTATRNASRKRLSVDMQAFEQEAEDGIMVFTQFADMVIQGWTNRQLSAMQLGLQQMEMFTMESRTFQEELDNDMIRDYARMNRRREDLTMMSNERIKQSYVDLGSAIESTMIYAASTIGTIIGELASNQEVTGGRVLAGLLDILGTFALTVGPMLVATGLGLQAILALQGAGAVAAGLLLIAAGAGLKAAAASLRSAGDANAAGGGSGGGMTFGTTTSQGGNFSPRDTESGQSGGTTTVLVFNQTVLDAGGARTIIDGLNGSAGRTSGRISSRAFGGRYQTA